MARVSGEVTSPTPPEVFLRALTDFSPRRPEEEVDPLDQQPFGNSNAGITKTLQFKIPETVIKQRQPAPAHEEESQPARRMNDLQAPAFPVENFDEKITSRSVAHRAGQLASPLWRPSARRSPS